MYLNSANCNVQNSSMCFEWNNLQSKVLIFTKSRSRSKFDSTIHKSQYLATGNDVTLLKLTKQAESPLQAVFHVKVCCKKAENQVQK